MRISELFEQTQSLKPLVVFPGRFQPFHLGHRQAYDYLTGKYGQDRVYVATSDRVDPPRSPFAFNEKIRMITATGIAPGQVVQTRDPYRAVELTGQFDPERTLLIFAVSEKDMRENPRFGSWTRRDGTPAYLQPLPADQAQAQPMSQHGYITVVPTVKFSVMGQPMTSASQLRDLWANADAKQRRQIITDLYGRYDARLHQLFDRKLQG
jgi:hypothetical protein